MNKRLAFAFASAALALGAVFPGAASAQRVIEETLILRDPTVAAPRNWLIGAALEYWYISGEYNITNSAGDKIAEGDIKYSQPGFNVYAGYGDFTVLFTSRSGDGDIDLTYAPGALGPAASLQTKSKVEQEDREISLRWIFLKRQHFAPYVVVGYSWTDYEEEETFVTPGFFWTATGTATRRETIEYRAPLVGLGAIIPISERFGVRVDGRLKFFSADRTASGRASVSDDGVGGDLTGTAYINIFEGLNAQLGGRFTHLNGGDAIGSVSRWGWFAMLGYTLRF
jgi:hypothetical protein